MPKPLPGHAPVQATQRRLGPIIIVGVLAGFLAGLFGVGGGLLIVPGLVFAGMDQRLAHGTSLAAVVPIAVASLITYASGGNVDWPAALWLSVGAAGGVVIGTKLLHILPVRTLGLLFSAVLVASAVRLFFETDATGRTPLTLTDAILLVAIGVVTGLLAGLLGVGGGLVTVPAMILLFAIPPVIAKGTSVAVIIPTARDGHLAQPLQGEHGSAGGGSHRRRRHRHRRARRPRGHQDERRAVEHLVRRAADARGDPAGGAGAAGV